jgi:PAS domain S-box-containing protein
MGEQEAILVVDADPEAALLLSDFLEREGYSVAVAATGGEGLRRIRQERFALALIDLELPDIDPTVLVTEAGRVEAPPEVIVVTGRATVDSAIHAVESRSAGYIVKPVDLSRLGAIVARVFERRRLARDNARLHAELTERLTESEALAAISATVSSTLDVREALRRICRELAHLLGADTSAAYLHEPATGQLVPAAAYHVPKEYLATLSSTPLPLKEQGFFLPLWADRRPVFTDDVARDARFTHAMFRSFPHQSGLLLPLIVDDEVIGGFYLVWWTARRRFSEHDLRGLERVSEQVGFFLRNARLYEQVERNQRRLEVLNDVSRRLAAAHDPQQVLTIIVNEAARLVGAEAAGIRLLDGDDLVVGARTESASTVMSRPRLKVGESLTGLVVARGAPVVVEDLAADTRYDPAHKQGALAQGYRGFIGVPLNAHGHAVGTLNVFTRGARRFLPDEIALLSALADQAALAIDRSQLLHETEEGRALLERISHAAIAMQSSWEREDRLAAFVRAAREVVGFDRVTVFLLTGDGSELELVTAGDPDAPDLRLPVTPDAGPYHEALKSRRPVAVLSDEDLARVLPLDRTRLDHPYLRSRRFVVAPLVVGERVIGVVSADNKTSRRPISRQSVEPFGSLCQNLAMALEESRLYTAARAREQEATRLYAVTRQLATSLDRERLLDVIAEQALVVTGCDAVGIFIYDVAREALVFHRGLRLPTELTSGLALRPGEGVAGRAYLERRPVWTRDRLNDPMVRHSPATQRIVDAAAPRAYLAVPIVSREETHGVLVVYLFTPHDFSPREVQLVSTLADHASLALQNARHFEEMRHREREAKTLSDGLVLLNQAARALHRTLEVDKMLDGALTELAQAFGASGALMHLLAEDGSINRSVGHWVSEGQPGDPRRRGAISDYVCRTRTPLLLRDVTKHPDFVHPANLAHGVRSIAAFPIVGQRERVLGILLLYYTTPQPFPDTETRLLTSYADQLATALENAGLYEETQTQRMRLAQIFDSTSDGIVLVSPSGEIQAANRQAGELLSFDAGGVIGTRVSDLLASARSTVPDYDRAFEDLEALLRDPGRGGEGDLELRRTGRTVHWTAQPTRDAAGGIVGLTLTLSDVTLERQASQMKTDFVSFVTHQLRTPLAGIKWMLELAAQAPEMTGEASSYVEDARAAAERLISLVNDLLDISRLESGKMSVALQPVSPAKLTRSVLDDLAPLIREKGHQFSVQDGSNATEVLADPQLLRQVILNLTSNAIKYTPSGGVISIALGRGAGPTARWAITDSGIGIPQGGLARLFEKFYRADNAHTVETEGTGLGLYLVRLIVERLDGRVWCESEEGRGSTFIFTLPVSG